MKNLCILFLLFFLAHYVSAQVIISPYSHNSKFTAGEAKRVGTINPLTGDSVFNVGFGKKVIKTLLPFAGKNELQNVYDSDRFNTAKSVSFSAIFRDSLNAPTSYVDVLSVIPDNSLFRVALSVQLTSAESKDTSKAKKQDDVALQRLMNGGGNVVLSVNRPLIYSELYKSSFCLLNATVATFFDVPAVNKQVYNPGAGVQIGSDFDFRIYTLGSQRQDGNILRFGFKGRFVWNAVNEKYNIQSELDKNYRDVAFFALQPYIGIAFFNLEYTFNMSNSSIFEDKRQILQLSVVPVKF